MQLRMGGKVGNQKLEVTQERVGGNGTSRTVAGAAIRGAPAIQGDLAIWGDLVNI